MLLIVGSNRDDVIYFQSLMKDKKEEVILNKYKATVGTIVNQIVMVLQDVHTSYVSSALATYLINKYFILLVFIVGTCQTLTPELKVGDVAVSEYAVFGDVDQIRTLRGTKLGQIPGYPQLFPSDPYLLKNINDVLNDISGITHKNVTYMNASFFRHDQALLEELGLEDKITSKNKDRVIDGETTGIALACHLFDIPFISIKVVEGKAGEKTPVDDYVKVLEKFSLVDKAIISCIGEISRNDVVRE